MNIVFQFLNKDMESVDVEAKILYALEIIERVIFKLKWNMRR